MEHLDSEEGVSVNLSDSESLSLFGNSDKDRVKSRSRSQKRSAQIPPEVLRQIRRAHQAGAGGNNGGRAGQGGGKDTEEWKKTSLTLLSDYDFSAPCSDVDCGGRSVRPSSEESGKTSGHASAARNRINWAGSTRWTTTATSSTQCQNGPHGPFSRGMQNPGEERFRTRSDMNGASHVLSHERGGRITPLSSRAHTQRFASHSAKSLSSLIS